VLRSRDSNEGAGLPLFDAVQRVLIFRVGSLGDMVVALPCFHRIARTFPNAERVLLTNVSFHAKGSDPAMVLGGSGLIHDYMYYPGATRNAGKLLGLSARVRRFRPDLLIHLMPLRTRKHAQRDRLFFRLGGVKHIVGLPDETDLTRQFDALTGRYESEASRLARSICELGEVDVNDPANWNLVLTEEEKRAASAALGALAGRSLIACGPGTKMQAKDWGRDNWRALLNELLRRYPDHGLVLIGSKEDTAECDFAAQEWSAPKVNLCGKLTPRESAAVIAHARIFLGPDSGPMHLAASVGTPAVAAFSAHALPGVWFPTGPQHRVIYHQTSCYNCRLETCIVEHKRCITSITVSEMLDAAIAVLERRADSLAADRSLSLRAQ
jgi:heptosyltransferase III